MVLRTFIGVLGRPFVVVSCVALLAAFLSACGGNEEKAATPTAAAKASPAATTAPAATSAPAATTAPTGASPAATAAPSAKVPGLTPPPAGRVQRILDSPTAKLWPQRVRDWVSKYHPDNFKAPDPYKPVRGGVVISTEGWADPPSWDTTKAQQFSTIFNTTWVARNLVTWQQQWGSDSVSLPPTPDLAESWESSGDGTVWTFKLIKGLMWPDVPPTMKSREMTAEDVKYSMDIYMFQSIFKGEWTDMDRIEAPDKYTVKFISKKPIPNFPAAVASYHMPLFPKEWYECTDDCKKNYFVGIGPFTIKERVKDVRTVFVRNPNYLRKDPVNGEQLPYVNELQKITIPDVAAQIAAARTGKVDTTDVQSWRGQFFDLLKTNPDVIVGIASTPDKWFSGGPRIYFPLDQAPWNDKRVRQAISMAIDRQKVVHEVYEDMMALPSAVPYFEWREFSPMVNDEMLGAGKYNPQKAKQLLKEAGFEKGLKLELENSFVFATAAQVTANEWLLTQQMLKEVGIDLQWIDPPDVRTHAIKVLTYQKFSRPYQYGVAPVGSRSDMWIYNTYKCKGQANYGGVCDPDLDKLVEKVSSLPRPSAERAAVAKQIEEWFWENVPWVPLTETWRLGWRQPWIINVSTTSDTTQFYAGAGGDKVWVDCEKARKYNMPSERRPDACK